MVKVNEVESVKAESPTKFADKIGIEYAKGSNQSDKKKRGQFFTPIPIAKFMANLAKTNNTHYDILDPGFGTGILTSALIEHQIESNSELKTVVITAYETDESIILYAEQTLQNLKLWAISKGVELTYKLIVGDFIASNYQYLSEPAEKYDIIITNPPYYKLGKEHISVQQCKELVSGQPNIYSFFLGIGAALLREDGDIISITPRSFSSGRYFQAFRDFFFSKVNLMHVHLFDSRRSSFSRDKVLQEVLILKATKNSSYIPTNVLISSSGGISDLQNPIIKTYDITMVIDSKSTQKVVHIPINDNEEQVLNLVLGWDCKLADLNINISTGPVVTFRATKFLVDHDAKLEAESCPLIRLHNVTRMELKYPYKLKGKADKILILKDSMSILLPNKDYVLLRRFSTKDDKSRLIAAPYSSAVTQSDFVGIDNAVNYIYRKNGTLNYDEIMGLSALLNCDIFDTYFRIFNGNVNVSATELREMRFPNLETIKEIGNQIIADNNLSNDRVNEIINNMFFKLTPQQKNQ